MANFYFLCNKKLKFCCSNFKFLSSISQTWTIIIEFPFFLFIHFVSLQISLNQSIDRWIQWIQSTVVLLLSMATWGMFKLNKWHIWKVEKNGRTLEIQWMHEFSLLLLLFFVYSKSIISSKKKKNFLLFQQKNFFFFLGFTDLFLAFIWRLLSLCWVEKMNFFFAMKKCISNDNNNDNDLNWGKKRFQNHYMNIYTKWNIHTTILCSKMIKTSSSSLYINRHKRHFYSKFLYCVNFCLW